MKLTRPPFVLTHPADASGCGFHRIVRPCQILGRMGYLNGRAETQFLQDSTLAAINPDVIVLQRQAEDSQVETIKRYKRTCPNAFIVFEIDDALSAVPEKSWHAPYMTPNIDSKLRKAARECDVITVTTDDLAIHMSKICDPGTKVRVVPNMLSREDMESCFAIRQQLNKTSVAGNAKLRIGWGGGIGHIGDLEMLNDAMLALKDEAEFYFIGMDPKVPEGVTKYYLGSVPPERYLASLQAMNCDLMIAPLEHNLFNECKSNLRLLEAGACQYPVIATPIAPYHTKTPPVFAYADSTDAWIQAIRDFIALSPDSRARHGKAMHAWVSNNYVMETNAESRLLGWLPDNSRPFKPRLNEAASGVIEVHTDEEFHAALKTTNDILYLRPGAVIQDPAKSRLIASAGDIICGLSNDGGPWGFPNINQFTHLDPLSIAKIDKVCGELESANLIDLGVLSGPCVLMRRKAIAAIGHPDTSHMSLELAILDWCSNAKAHGLSLKLNPSVFVAATQTYGARSGEAEMAQTRIQYCWPRSENDDAALRALREEIELRFHRDAYRTMPPAQRNDYKHWFEAQRRGPAMLARADSWSKANGGLPDIADCMYPGRVNQDSEWVFFYPSGAQIPDDSWNLFHESLTKNPSAKIFYGDHDYINPAGEHDSPDFKPIRFDFYMALSRDYLTQACVIHRSLIPPALTEITESELFKLIMNNSMAGFAHIPRIMATLPMPNATAMIELAKEKTQFLQQYLLEVFKGTGVAVSVEQNPQLPLIRNVSFQHNAAAANYPKASIIIPTRDNLEMLGPAVSTVLSMTTYPNFEVVVVDNGSTRQEMLDHLASITDPRVKVHVDPQAYNWSAINNQAAREVATGDVLVFLNDDTRVLAPGWLTELVGCAIIPTVGAAGARLLYPHGLVQHVGVVANNGLNGHIHKGLPINNPGTNAYAITVHEATAVTGACLAVTRAKFEEVGGFLEALPTNFNDVAFCLELMKHNYVNVLCASAELQHFEGVSRNANGIDAEALRKIQVDGATLFALYPGADPYWNPNLLFTYVQNGQMVAGMNMDSFTYPPPDHAWGKPDIDRVLVIGNTAIATEERRNLDAVYTLAIAGYQCQIHNPPLLNSGPWDLRVPSIAAAAFKKLGLSKILVSDIGENNMQLLSFLTQLDIPVEYRPINAESVCPRTNLMPNTFACDAGYKNGLCQACMDTNSSPHGNVIIPGYWSEWMRFFTRIDSADMSYLEKPEYREAIETIYGAKDHTNIPVQREQP